MSDIEKRIDKLERTINELRNELRTLRVLVRTDYPSALNKIRFITEKILGQLCKEHSISWGAAEPTLENMIGPLVAKQIIPRPIAIHVRSVQANSSPGSHFQESPLSAAHLEIAQMALVEFLEWYYSTRPNLDPIAAVSSADSLSRSAPPGRSSISPFAYKAIVAGLIGTLAMVVIIVLIYWMRPHDHKGNTTNAVTNDTTQTSPGQAADQAAANQAVNLLMASVINSRTKPVAPLCDSFEPRIESLATERNLLQAIATVADYQLALLQHDANPNFTSGLFRSDSYGITCNIPEVADWKPEIGLNMGPRDDSVQTAALETLLNIDGPNPHDNLCIVGADTIPLPIRYFKNNTDDAVKFYVDQFLDSVGAVTLNDFEQVGSLRVLHFHIATNNTAENMIGAAFERNGLWFAVLSVSAANDEAGNLLRLHSILQAITFDDDPAIMQSIDQIRKQVTQPNDIPQILLATRKLAMLGQFRQAVDELAALTAVLDGTIPEPVEGNNSSNDETYGMKLVNPDPQFWQLQSQQMGALNMVMLQPIDTKVIQLLGIGVINPVTIGGPRAYDLVGPNAPGTTIDNFLRSTAKTLIYSAGGTTGDDSFGSFRKIPAYDVHGTNPDASKKDPAVRERVIVVAQPDHCVLLILMLGTPEEIDKQETLLGQSLFLYTDAPSPPPQNNPQ